MRQWKWTIYDRNEVDSVLYQYFKNCGRMKKTILEALEILYLPYALEYSNAPPLEIQRAFQKSIELLQSRVRLMSLDAGIATGEAYLPVKDRQVSIPIQVSDERPIDISESPARLEDSDDEDWNALIVSEVEIDFGLG
jgi:hypothetical protein